MKFLRNAFPEIFKNIYFEEYLQTTASISWLYVHCYAINLSSKNKM